MRKPNPFLLVPLAFLFTACSESRTDDVIIVTDGAVPMDGPVADTSVSTDQTVDASVDDTGTPMDARTLSDASVMDGTPPPVCPPAQPTWAPEMPAFRRATAAWGLEGVQGEYLSVTDLNGDHWPDLLIRKGGGADDFGPAGERHKWVLINTGDRGFEDRTKRSRLFSSRLNPAPSFGRPGKVLVSGDVDNDGDLDVFIGQGRTDAANGEAETSDLLLNQGDGNFLPASAESAARFADVPSNPAGAAFVDFDRDGLLDLWIVHNELPGLVPMQDTLLKGDGAGGFTDVTREAGLLTAPFNNLFSINTARAHSWGWGAVACDLNADGLPELMASSYGRAPNHLWAPLRIDDTVSYRNESLSSGYAFDENQDWHDNLSAQCFCDQNPEAAECDTCPPPADMRVCDGLRNAFGPNARWNHQYGREAFSLGGVTGTTVCIDVDNDQHLDLVNYEIVHSDTGANSDPTQVLFNTGEAQVRFERPGPEALGLMRTDGSFFWDHGDMTGAVFDFDNDGWPDIYIGAAEYAGNRGLLYHQHAPRQFRELTVDDSFEHFRAHGVAVADFDRDGDLDLLLGHSRFRCDGFEGTECAPNNQVQLFENVIGNRNHWIQMRLEGADGTNRAAIGARVSVTAGGFTQTQIVDGGHGRFGLQRDPMLHFGLGSACSAEVTILWPDAVQTVQRFRAEVDRRMVIPQGQDPMDVAPMVPSP